MIWPATAWIVSVDNTTTTSIVWNVSNKSEAITALYYDGYEISGYDPSANLLVQSGLDPGEYHFMSITTNATTTNATATTNVSAEESYYSQSASFWGFFAQWYYLIFIIVLLAVAMAVHWIFYFVAAFVSLYALAKFIIDNPGGITTDIWHIQYFIYGAFFLISLIMWAMRKRGR